MADPPVFVGADHVSVAEPLPPAAVSDVGAAGSVAATIVAPGPSSTYTPPLYWYVLEVSVATYSVFAWPVPGKTAVVAYALKRPVDPGAPVLLRTPLSIANPMPTCTTPSELVVATGSRSIENVPVLTCEAEIVIASDPPAACVAACAATLSTKPHA